MYNVYYIHEKNKGERETESPHLYGFGVTGGRSVARFVPTRDNTNSTTNTLSEILNGLRPITRPLCSAYCNVLSNSTGVRCVIKNIGECLNKKNYYSKRHIAINPPENTPPRFEHTYPIVLATF